jgi:hypothetical protein
MDQQHEMELASPLGHTTTDGVRAAG